MIVFIVGRDDKTTWQFVGVYDSRDLAEKACLDESYFIGAIAINLTTPIPISQWAGLYRPKSEGKVL